MSSADPISREVAWRVFASEYDDATLSFKEGDDDRAPNYVVTPTGAKINRLFVVGVLTETENVGNDGDMFRARISDPTGTFVSYAGQYQQEAMSFFREAEPPMFVALVGKARTYEPDDSDAIYTSVRPEEVNGVDGATRDRWNVQTARQTLARIDAVSSYFRGTVETDGANALLARLHDLDATAEHYDLDASYLTDLRRQCLEVLADMAGEDVDEAEATVDLTVEPPAAETEEPEGAEPTTADAADGDDRPDDSSEARGDDEESDGFDADDFSDVSQEPVDADAGDETSAAEAGDAPGTADGTAEADAATDTPAAADPGSDDGATAASDDAARSGSDAGDAGQPAGEDAAPSADGDTADVSGAGDPADAADEEGEWEWDEGEREELEEEFGAEFESASEFDPDEATVSGDDEEGRTADETVDETGEGTVDQGGRRADETVDETGEETAAGADETADATSDEPADETEVDGDAVSAEPDRAGEPTAPPSEDVTAEPADGPDGIDESTSETEDAGSATTSDDGPDEQPGSAAVDADEVVLGVLEDAAPDGLTHDEVVAAATDEGLSAEDAEQALDDLLMDGLCYESDDVVKPL